MATKAIAAVVVVMAAQVALGARQPVVGTLTSASIVMDGNCYLTGSAVSKFSEDITDERPADATGHGYASVNYPTPTGWVPSAFLSTDAGAGAASMAQLDAPAGKLHLYDGGWINCGKDSRTYGWVKGYATVRLTDIITLDKPAQVTIFGHVKGSTFGLSHDTANVDSVSAGMGADFAFWEFVGGEMGWQKIGYREIFRPTFIDTTNMFIGPGIPGPAPAAVDEVVSYTMELPAGDTYFTASLDASYSLQVSPGGSASVHMSFENTADFQILVPAGVTATSYSGTLPIAVPEPSSLAILGTVSLLAMRRRR